MIRVRYLLMLLACSQLLPAQFTLAPAFPPVTGPDGNSLPLAWLGGLNAPQWMTADLDGDGIDDLYLFDRAGDAQIALRGDGSGNYTIAPELTAGFPADLTNWVLLRDYDGDGNPDLFTYSARNDGLRIFRGRRDGAGLLTYAAAPEFAGLRYPYNGGTIPIFITGVDYPAVNDVDGDGDLDLLTFSVAGGYLEYYRNESVERGYGTDSLIYTLDTECWGGFFESGRTPSLDLSDTPGACANGVLAGTPVEPRHAGSTVLSFDYDGDGVQDIMLGDISFEYLVLGRNTGTRELAHVTEQDPTWKSEGEVANIPYFPGAYHLDVDQDGARDLVASPSMTSFSEDRQVGWYYRNVGTDAAPDFVFQTDELLVGESLDFGTNAYPGVVDVDGDGRPDVVIGNGEDFSTDGTINSRLRLLRNVTPPGGEVAFALVDDDYLGFSAYQRNYSAFTPAFGDLDGDGDQDAIVGERGGRLIYLENTAGAGQPVAFAAPVFEYMGIRAGQQAAPAIADLDRDGLPDLVVGNYNGQIRYYRNVGTATEPAFDAEPTVAQLGGINTNRPGFTTGYPRPLVLDYGDRFLLVTGNRAGTLEAYSFADPAAASFTALNDTVAGLDVGGFSAPAVADFDGDELLELVVGNQRGGLQYFRTDLAVGEQSTGLFTPEVSDFDFGVRPNPTTGRVQVRDLPAGRTQWLTLRSVDGRGAGRYAAHGRSAVDLDLTALPPGVYLLTVTGDAGTATRRVIRQR